MTTALFIAWENAGSKNLSLAAAAVIGVVIAFFIQLQFELAGSTTFETIATEFTIDRLKHSIRQWKYDNPPPWRVSVEAGASDWLAANRPEVFDSQRDKATADLAEFSLLSFLTHEEYDWQMERETYKGKVSGMVETAIAISRPDECSAYAEVDLRQRLISAGNLFAGAPLRALTGRLCLPPKTDLDISADGLTLRNPLCRISFEMTSPGGTFFVDPRSSDGDVTMLPEGAGSQFETRQMGIKVTTTFFRLRSQHRERKRYEEWAKRVVDRARKWFEN